MNNIKTISQHIRAQFPSLYEDHDIIPFMEAYYEYLEQTSLIYSKNLLSYDDIDETLEDFVEAFTKKYLDSFPFRAASDKRFLIKHILDLYQSKGSEASIKLLMKIIFGEDIEIYYPADDVFKVSDSKWVELKFIELSHDRTNYNFLGKTILSTDGGSSSVDNIITKSVNGRLIYILYLNQPQLDKFQKGTHVFIEGEEQNLSKQILGSANQIIIGSESAALYNIGDILTSTTGDGIGVEGRVESIKSVSDLASFSIVDGGYGYTTDVDSEVIVSDKIIETDATFTINPMTLCQQTLYQYAIDNTIATLSVGDTIKDSGSKNVGNITSANNTHIIVNPTISMCNNLTTIFNTTDVGEATPYAVSGELNVSVAGRTVGQENNKIGIKWDTPSVLYFDSNQNFTLDLFENVPTYNYILDTEQFNNWTASNATVSIDNEISPKINNAYFNTVDQIVEDGTSNFHGLSFPKNIDGGLNFSVYVKTSGRNVILRAAGISNAYAEFNLTTGAVIATGVGNVANAQIEDAFDGWYRCSLQLTGPGITGYEIILSDGTAHTNGLPVYTGNNSSGCFVFGAQLTNNYNPVQYQSINILSNSKIFKSRIKILDEFFGSGGNFSIGSIDLPETINVNTDYLKDYQSVQLNSIDYGFQVGVTDINSVISAALNIKSTTIGQIKSLTDLNPGSSYTNNLFVHVRNNFVYNYQKSDVLIQSTNPLGYQVGEIISGSGGAQGIVTKINEDTIGVKLISFLNKFSVGETVTGITTGTSDVIQVIYDTTSIMGSNAAIQGIVQRLPGSVQSIQLIDSGYGYTDGGPIGMKSANNILEISGSVILGGIGFQKGFWTTTSSHISTDKKIHDNDYYQDYSFEIKSKNSFNTYKNTIRQVIQSAGTRAFGKTNIVSSINNNIDTQTFITT